MESFSVYLFLGASCSNDAENRGKTRGLKKKAHKAGIQIKRKEKKQVRNICDWGLRELREASKVTISGTICRSS